jgi:hypothetical protein
MARKRVSVPVRDDLRQIAKIERRSIAGQAEVAIQQFVQHWRTVLPSLQHQGNANAQQRLRAK